MAVTVVGIILTGLFFNQSTTRLAVIAAAVLAQNHALPKIAGKLAQLEAQRHGLVHVGEEF